MFSIRRLMKTLPFLYGTEDYQNFGMCLSGRSISPLLTVIVCPLLACCLNCCDQQNWQWKRPSFGYVSNIHYCDSGKELEMNAVLNWKK